MIVKENTHILFIEPTGKKSEEPIIDDLTKKVQDVMLNATFPEYMYKGFHICGCGEFSDNRDWILPNGQITNSLAYHYIAEHREDVPDYEIEKIKNL